MNPANHPTPTPANVSLVFAAVRAGYHTNVGGLS
jgi:hypothetical protein